MASAILKSGKTAQEWLREAAQWRIAQENSADTPLGTVQKHLERVQKHLDHLTAALQNVTGELGKTHGAWISTRAELTELAHVIEAVHKNQHDLANVVLRMDNNLGHTVEKLGPSLLVVLSDKLRDLIQLEMAKESKPKPRPPIPPRPGL